MERGSAFRMFAAVATRTTLGRLRVRLISDPSPGLNLIQKAQAAMSKTSNFPTVHVRPATPDDLEHLVTWNAAMAWETEHKRLDAETLRRGVAMALAESARGRYFIAERDGRPAGSLLITTEWSDWRCADWWWIQSVYVEPSHRRQGVYAALYRHVEELARASENVCGLRLYVEKENAVAQRTYSTLGMRDAGYFMFEAGFGPEPDR